MSRDTNRLIVISMAITPKYCERFSFKVLNGFQSQNE